MSVTFRTWPGLALAAALAAGAGAWGADVELGAEAPAVAGTWLNSDAASLKDLRGYAVLLEFWGVT